MAHASGEGLEVHARDDATADPNTLQSITRQRILRRPVLPFP
jgi:hypothetical protein